MVLSMLWNDLQCTTDGTFFIKQKLFQSAARQDATFCAATFVACLSFFFHSIHENVIVDSHQTLIQYFCTNVFFLFACPIINLSKNGKNCIANLRFLRFLLIILKAVSNLDTTEQNHDINNISARFLKHKILKMNGVSLPTVAWVKKGSC